MSNFQKNLKVLSEKYTQKYIAEKTGFSQSSINNYLSKTSEPSIQFLVALKNAFGICIDDFLFSDVNMSDEVSYERFEGNYIVYYYNNNSYKGEVHTNIVNTLNYGVVSIMNERQEGNKVVAYGSFFKSRADAVKLLEELNDSAPEERKAIHGRDENFYKGSLYATGQNIFLSLANAFNGDHTFMIFNNPPSKAQYLGGAGTVNSVSRGREHNPCVEFIIISRKLIDKPDGEIYECLKFDEYSVNLEFAMKDVIELFKRLYVDENDISSSLTENQKRAIIENKLEYHFNEIIEANVFRFAKISNKEDDKVYKLVKEGIDV